MIPADAEIVNDVFGVSHELLMLFEFGLLKPRGRLSSLLRSYRQNQLMGSPGSPSAAVNH
jgi:hypothetical protein